MAESVHPDVEYGGVFIDERPVRGRAVADLGLKE
jgi:hypothetical protein